jgi:hypothetical protein
MGYSVLLPVVRSPSRLPSESRESSLVELKQVPNYKGAKTEEVHDDTKFVKPFAAILRKERLDVSA